MKSVRQPFTRALDVRDEEARSVRPDVAQLMKLMEYTRKYPRKEFRENVGIPVTIIQFGRLHRQDITVHGIDISEGRLGVISSVPLEPGFIWFWRPVGKQKGGMVVWSKKVSDHFRAGIQFLPIPIGPNEYLQNRS